MKKMMWLPALLLAACASGQTGTQEGAPHMVTTGSAEGLSYRLLLPAGGSAGRPLVLMLHGCTQTAESFQLATRMPEHAHDVVLLYPEQPPTGNPQRCWNWFAPVNQARSGEAARLAALTELAVAQSGADRSRVYVAGISAGGMMAAVLAAAYPELFAAIGVHSAGAFPTAAGVNDALSVMRGEGDAAASAAAAAAVMGNRLRTMPAVIVHGDDDAVVRPINAQQAAESWWSVHARAGGGAAPVVASESGTSNGRSWRRERWADAAGAAPVVELWRVGGLGHAWSGGIEGGSYADPGGPDAAQIILRFLLARRRP